MFGGTSRGANPGGKPGTASQFQRRELGAVPALRRAHRSAFSRESCYAGGPMTRWFGFLWVVPFLAYGQGTCPVRHLAIFDANMAEVLEERTLELQAGVNTG